MSPDEEAARGERGGGQHPSDRTGASRERPNARGFAKLDRLSVGVALVACVVHAPSLFGGYTQDDYADLVDHPVVRGDVALWEVFTREFFGRPLGEGWSSSYRPLTTLTWALEERVFAGPFLHHTVNLFLFAILCTLVVRLLRGFDLSERATGWASLGFALLPVHVENVASIVGRADVLAAVACLLSLAVLRPASSAEPRGYLAHGAASALYLCGLLCKETVALFPGLVAWLCFTAYRMRGDSVGRGLLGASSRSWGVALVGLGYLVWRQHMLPVGLPPDFVAADNPLVERAGWLRFWGVLAILGHHLEFTLVPVRLCADHTYSDIVLPSSIFGEGWPWAALGAIVLAWVLLDGGRAVRGRSSGLVVATFLAYAVVGQFVVSTSVVAAERLVLWPSVFGVAAFAWGLDRAWPVPAGIPRAVSVVLGAVALVWAARTVDRTLDWRDDLSLRRSSALSCPAAIHNRIALAHAWRKAGHPAEALWNFAVAGAGRHAFPEPFHGPMLDAELDLPLEDRLARLPELAGHVSPPSYWHAILRYLHSIGATAEAELAWRLAKATSGTSATARQTNGEDARAPAGGASPSKGEIVR